MQDTNTTTKSQANITKYIVIPAYARRSLISDGAKLAYGLINSFDDFYASNQYIAKIFATSIPTVKRWIAELKNEGLISTSKKITKRHITTKPLLEDGGFYAVVPDYIYTNPLLTNKAKIIYADITALTNECGYCYATNERLAKQNNCTTRTVQNAIEQLEFYGFIEVKHERNTRRIYLKKENEKVIYRDEKNDTSNNSEGVKKMIPGGEKNDTYINTYIYTINSFSDENELPLHAKIRKWFKIVNPDYYHDGKQAKIIKNIINRFKDENKIFYLLEKYVEIKSKKHSDYWKSVPMTPAGFWSRVDNIIELQKNIIIDKNKIQDYNESMEELKNSKLYELFEKIDKEANKIKGGRK